MWSIPASSDTEEPEGRQMKQRWTKYWKKSPFNLTHIDIYEKVIFCFKQNTVKELFIFSQILHIYTGSDQAYLSSSKTSPNCRHQTFTIYPTWKSVKLCFYSWGRQDFEFWPLSKKDKESFSRECFLFITGRERREDSHQRLCSPIKQIRIKKFLSFKRIPRAHLEKSANLRNACFFLQEAKKMEKRIIDSLKNH